MRAWDLAQEDLLILRPDEDLASAVRKLLERAESHPGSLKDHIPLGFMEHGKFHTFGVPVQTRPVVPVKPVDDILVVGEIKLSVGDAVRLQIGLDDIAAQTVGRLVQNDVHQNSFMV